LGGAEPGAPEVFSWNVNVQHAFTTQLTLETVYVGSHGSKLVGIHDIQPRTLPSLTHAERTVRPAVNAQLPLPQLHLPEGNSNKSNYDGLQVTFSARDYHHLSFVPDTRMLILLTMWAPLGLRLWQRHSPGQHHPEREYASSDYDMHHRFTFSPTYNIPGKHGFGEMLEGWEVASIVSLYGAPAWGPMDAGNDLSHTGEATTAGFLRQANRLQLKRTHRTNYLPGDENFDTGASAAENDPICSCTARD